MTRVARSNSDARICCQTARRGFTLIELLVAISVLLILATMTFTLVNVTMNGDRIRSSARQLQSFIEGARDRAIYANEARGVRLLLDPVNPTVVSSMIYIGSPTRSSEGAFSIGRDWNGDTFFEDNQTINPLGGFEWDEMEERGLISNGQPIEIADNFYTIVKVAYPTSSDPEVWRLTRPFHGMNTMSTGPATIDGGATPPGFSLQLNPAVLPNAEPRLLTTGVVIDLRQSYIYGKLPRFWYTVANDGGTPDDNSSMAALAASRQDDTVNFSSRMDLLFSPRGVPTGLLTSAGNLHLVLSDNRDVTAGRGLYDVDSNGNSTIDEVERNVGDRIVVTVTTQTGRVSTHPIFMDNTADPFRYAELGEEAK